MWFWTRRVRNRLYLRWFNWLKHVCKKGSVQLRDTKVRHLSRKRQKILCRVFLASWMYIRNVAYAASPPQISGLTHPIVCSAPPRIFVAAFDATKKPIPSMLHAKNTFGQTLWSYNSRVDSVVAANAATWSLGKAQPRTGALNHCLATVSRRRDNRYCAPWPECDRPVFLVLVFPSVP